MHKQEAQQFLSDFPDVLRKPDGCYLYGTAGYRGRATEDLTRCLCRASLVAFVRSSTFAGKYIGVMVTASHNPARDNGMKIIDHNGDCMEDGWERAFDEAVNCEDDKFHETMNKIHRKYGQMKDFGDGLPAKILIGRDTRTSGEAIVGALKDVLSRFNAEVHDYGIVSTPQMHWIVRNSNKRGDRVCGEAYFEHISSAHRRLRELARKEAPEKEKVRRKVDTANGVIRHVFDKVPGLDVVLMNGDGELNYRCGSDYVKSRQRGLPGVESTEFVASFDGDGDRLVYFRTNPFLVLDGDRLCCLTVLVLMEILQGMESDLKIGAVLSFYSNSAAVKWMERHVPVSISHTGVKNFTKLAKNYDLGVYFEPNGHGSCYFSQRALKVANEGDSVGHRILRVLSELFDPSIGDAFANFLILELTANLDAELYEELPTRDIVVHVKDKNVLVMDHQNEVVRPEGLQAKINDLLKKYKGRGFVRPSGTENCVRVHSEAKKQRTADELCVWIGEAVYEACGGIGNHPEVSYVDEDDE